MFKILLNDSLSEYTQSVKGHGRQQSTRPSIVGTAAQNRPGTSKSCEHAMERSAESWHAHIRQSLEIWTFVKKAECTLLVHMFGLPLMPNAVFLLESHEKDAQMQASLYPNIDLA